jgi:DNA-binding response OmpR family regulator
MADAECYAMKRSLLLVEDDPLMREFITDYFKKEQWDVHEAENGRMALEIFEQASIDLLAFARSRTCRSS